MNKQERINGTIASSMKSIRKEKRVLVVDDEPDITIGFKLALEESGFIVDTSQDPLCDIIRVHYELVRSGHFGHKNAGNEQI